MWTRGNSPQNASWQLKAISRRWIPAKLVHLDSGGGELSTKSIENKLTERSSPFSKCPGQHIAELSTWLGVACILAAFDVSPALDDNGRPIDVRYALSGSNNLIASVEVFLCLKSRSLFLPQSTTSVSLLNQGPVLASREFNLCIIDGHPVYHAVREHSYLVNGDRRLYYRHYSRGFTILRSQ